MQELERIYSEISGGTYFRKIIQSETTDGIDYEVTFTKGGIMTCDCPGYMYRKDCKHLSVALKGLTGFQRAMLKKKKDEIS